MGLISILFKDPVMFLILAVLLLYSIIFHEVAHGWVALLFGDDTAKRSGRLSLNPLSHIDPMGALMLFAVGFGWAKPVPVDYYNLRNSRLALICVSLAGCLTNIFIAAMAILLLEFQSPNSPHIIISILVIVKSINLILGAFNLIPIPPLDGSKILMGFLSREAQMSFARLEPYGFLILIILLITNVLNPVITFMESLVYYLIVGVLSFFR
jgi:Zn-dependent protease